MMGRTQHRIDTDGRNKTMKGHLLNNEDGSVMALALALLMLLTLIGISATTTSMIEIQITGAKKSYTEHLFLAEGAAMQCAQALHDSLTPSSETFYNDERDKTPDEVDTLIRDLNFSGSQSSSISTSGTTGYATLYLGVVGSMKMGQPSLHAYKAYGWHDTPHGRVTVELGYRRAFE